VLSVLHIGKFYPPAAGGMERIVQSLCASTRGRLESRVLAYHSNRSTVTEMLDGVQVTRVGILGSAGSVPISPAFVSHLRRIDSDLIILHEPNPWALLAYAAAAPPAPLAIWYHSDVVRPRLQYELFYAPLARHVYRRARRFLVSSSALADHSPVLRRYRDRIDVVPFGIVAEAAEDSVIRGRADGIRQRLQGPIVLFAGRLVAYKGVDVLIDAIAGLPVTLVVAGDGPMRSSWTTRAARTPGRQRIVFTGEIPDEELRAYFRASDMLVLPSITRAEAFGLVQLEAMVNGKPVISTALPTGVPWVNRDEVTGLVVRPGDASALRAAIQRLATDAQLRVRLGAAGARRAREDFAIERMANRFVHSCYEIAGRPQPAAVSSTCAPQVPEFATAAPGARPPASGVPV
jgi:glycosyltransferase involved in cell wall biosynthesis